MTEPFFTVYPVISTRGRDPLAFDTDEGFYMQFIIKPRKLTRGDYVFVFNSANDPSVGACHIEVNHIGQHYPCLKYPQLPTQTPLDDDNIIIAPHFETPNGRTNCEGAEEKSQIYFTVITFKIISQYFIKLNIHVYI